MARILIYTNKVEALHHLKRPGTLGNSLEINTKRTYANF